MILLGVLIAAWIGALIGMVAMAILSSAGRADRCPRPCCAAARRGEPVPLYPPPPVARHAAPR